MARIEITNFINPHQFWFKYADVKNPQVDRIERELAHSWPLVVNPKDARVGEIIAVNWLERGKWIRVCIDKIEDDGKHLNVWAIDYAEPIRVRIAQTSLIEDDIKELCETSKSSICLGAVYGVMPDTVSVFVSIDFFVSKLWKCIKCERFFFYFSKLPTIVPIFFLYVWFIHVSAWSTGSPQHRI